VNPKAEGTFEAVSHIRQSTGKYRDRDRFALMLEDLNWMALSVSAESVLNPEPGLWVVPAKCLFQACDHTCSAF